MADLTVTATSVVPGTNYTEVGTYLAGEAITAGQPLYLDSSNLAWKGDANVAAGAKANVVGIAMNNAGAGQKITIGKGEITFGSIITAAIVYVLSDTAGGIKPIADQASGDYLTILGWGISATTMKVDPKYSGYAKA